MKVELLHSTPLDIASKAIRKCWDSGEKSDSYEGTKCPACNEMYEHPEDECCANCGSSNYFNVTVCGEDDKALIEKIGNKYKHSSTLEHLVYNFELTGVSRAFLQENSRHRIASPSVKSTRYTLKELQSAILGTAYHPNFEIIEQYIVLPPLELYRDEDAMIIHHNFLARQLIDFKESRNGMSNDIWKYGLPECYKTELVMTINARSLQNYLSLRTSSSALWEIQKVARAMFESLPQDHKYLFEHCLPNLDETE